MQAESEQVLNNDLANMCAALMFTGNLVSNVEKYIDTLQQIVIALC